MSDPGKSELVLFSGGFDSTVMVDQYLKEGQSVTLLDVDGEMLRIDHEQHAKRTAYQYFQGRLPKINATRESPVLLNWKSIMLRLNGHRASFGQMPIWFIAAFSEVDPAIHSGVSIGYCVGDQAAHLLHHLQDAWAALWKVARVNQPFVPLRFPLLDLLAGKPWIVEYAETHLSTIVDALSYCENPFYFKRPLTDHHKHLFVCDECPSCLRMRGFAVHARHLAEPGRGGVQSYIAPHETEEPQLMELTDGTEQTGSTSPTSELNDAPSESHSQSTEQRCSGEPPSNPVLASNPEEAVLCAG